MLENLWLQMKLFDLLISSHNQNTSIPMIMKDWLEKYFFSVNKAQFETRRKKVSCEKELRNCFSKVHYTTRLTSNVQKIL